MEIEIKKDLIDSYLKYIKIILGIIGISIISLISIHLFLAEFLIITASLGLSFVCFYYKNKILDKKTLSSKIIFFSSIVLIIMFASQFILSEYNLSFIEPLNVIVLFSPLIILIVNSINAVLINKSIAKWAEENSLFIKIGGLSSGLYILIAVGTLLMTICLFFFIYTFSGIDSIDILFDNNNTYIVTKESYNWMHPEMVSTTYDQIVFPGFIVKKDVSPY